MTSTDTIATVFATLDATQPTTPAVVRATGQIAWVLTCCANTQPAATDAETADTAPAQLAARIAATTLKAVKQPTVDAVVTAAIVAASLAAANLQNAGVKDATRGIIAGHDVATRIIHTLTGHTDYDVTYAAAVLGATTAANTSVNANLAARLDAYGIAATQAARLHDTPGDTAARRAADAADTAVEAALLAAHGFTGPASGIDGRRGVLTVIAPDHQLVGLNDGGGVPVGVSFDAADLIDDTVTVPQLLTARQLA